MARPVRQGTGQPIECPRRHSLISILGPRSPTPSWPAVSNGCYTKQKTAPDQTPERRILLQCGAPSTEDTGGGRISCEILLWVSARAFGRRERWAAATKCSGNPPSRDVASTIGTMIPLARGTMETRDDDLVRFEAHGAAALPEEGDEGYVQHNGARIWFATFGSGTPVILLHGGLGHSGNWGYQVPALIKAGYRVVLCRQSRPWPQHARCAALQI